LANLYLRPLDDILRQYTGDGSSWYHNTPKSLRWMDDIWLFSNDEGLLRHAQVALQKGMNELDLNMNIAKTDVLVGDDLIEAGAKIQHSAVDADLAGPATGEPLAALVDRLLTTPEKAPRTSVRFATKRMRDHDIYSHVDGFVAVTERMPQAADALARLFRDAGYSPELEDWYIEYLASSWHAIDWSAAQLGTMFSSSKPPGKRVIELFANLLADPGPLVMTALVAQRVAAWEPDLARAAIRAAVDRAHHPLIRRVLALGAIGAGEERDLIRRWLNEFEETSMTLAMLEDRGWKVPVAKDFAGNGPN
jgi:hypothetical protein